MTETPTIAQALAAVMADIGGVAKTGENRQQNYRFRGVDAVVNAVGPALRKHGVLMVPHAGIGVENSYTTGKNQTLMTRVVLPVTFAFHGPAGDVIDCHVYGEASDAGDKAYSKAHSVAWRVAMLQVFAIPTDDPDPDESSHERTAETPARLVAIAERSGSLAEDKKNRFEAWVQKRIFSDQAGWFYEDIPEGWWDQLEELLDRAEDDEPARVKAPRPVEDTADPTLLDDGRPFTEDEK